MNNNHRFLIPFFIMALPIILNGCGSKPLGALCSTDNDCSTGLYCTTGGLCWYDCLSNAGCLPGGHCDGRGRCTYPDMDGGAMPDGGPVHDGGALLDGGPIHDGGAPWPDGGPVHDGGAYHDGGAPWPDGGPVHDGGAFHDGGAMPDGGAYHDGGVPLEDGGVPLEDGGIPADGGLVLLEHIELTPEIVTLELGGAQQFKLIGYYSDGSQKDLTPASMGTTYESSDPITLRVDANGQARAVAIGGPVSLYARNSGLGDTASVTVVAAPPSLTSIEPQQVIRGSQGVQLTGIGSAFIEASTLTLNGANLPTVFVNQNKLTAYLPDWATAQMSLHQVAVFTPEPGGGTSNSLPFYVVAPPSISSISPDSGLQGTVVRVAFYGTGLIGCQVAVGNPGITVSNVTYSGTGLHMFATLSISNTAAAGQTRIKISNLSGSAETLFTVIEDVQLHDLYIGHGQVVFLTGVQAYRNITIETGAIIYSEGLEPLQFLATGDVVIRGEIIVSGERGKDGYYNPADGGAGGSGGGGGGGGGDGDSQTTSSGGLGTPPGKGSSLPPVGAGTPSGAGGGIGAGSGISGGCGQAGGGGAFGGNGGGGGGDSGVGTGGAGGQANLQGSNHNGGTGGGGGSTCGPNSGGGGGGGGGVLIIATTGGDITIDGALHADGGGGGDGFYGTGGGGGGSGGRITITTAGGQIVLNDTVSVRGGQGGRSDAGDGGGGGGGGRIIVDTAGGSLQDTYGFYDARGNAGGLSRDNGYNGESGQDGVIEKTSSQP